MTVQIKNLTRPPDEVNDALAVRMGLRPQFKIIWAIIVALSVLVVDGLAWQERPTDHIAHYETVLCDVAVSAHRIIRREREDVAVARIRDRVTISDPTFLQAAFVPLIDEPSMEAGILVAVGVVFFGDRSPLTAAAPAHTVRYRPIVWRSSKPEVSVNKFVAFTNNAAASALAGIRSAPRSRWLNSHMVTRQKPSRPSRPLIDRRVLAAPALAESRNGLGHDPSSVMAVNVLRRITGKEPVSGFLDDVRQLTATAHTESVRVRNLISARNFTRRGHKCFQVYYI